MRTEERLLLVRAKVLLECVDTAPLQDQADLIIKEIQEILDQPEPLTPRQGLAEYKKGYARAELDLKREPLSDVEIAKLWANKSPMNEFECTRLVEKAHGIGVDDE